MTTGQSDKPRLLLMQLIPSQPILSSVPSQGHPREWDPKRIKYPVGTDADVENKQLSWTEESSPGNPRLGGYHFSLLSLTHKPGDRLGS